jgi:hypothetical protein
VGWCAGKKLVVFEVGKEQEHGDAGDEVGGEFQHGRNLSRSRKDQNATFVQTSRNPSGVR